jgi:tol-pal system protein YbgF
MRRRALAGGRVRPGQAAGLALATVLAAVLGGGCATSGSGAKSSEETKPAPPADSPAALRQEIDRLRADIAELRTRLESAQRAGTEHADRTAQETRAEFDAVRKAMEASSRHDLQRQVEVLDAQARRVDLLERRVSELSQTLRRVELGIGGIESQVARLLDGNAAPAGAARGGAAARPSEPRPAEEPRPATSAGDGAATTSAAGSGLTPPAMLGPSRALRPAASSAPPSRPAAETKADSPARPQSAEASPAGRGPDASSATPSRPAADPAPRVAKAAPPTPEPKAPSAAPAPARAPKPGTPAPAAGPVTARALFDRAMESWNKGEQGQAVLEFDELVQTFPSDPLAASAQFRIGEAYYAARDFERATVEYKKAVDLAPKGKDTPQALLRLGLAYRAQKKESDARQAWNQLVRDFPESDASEEARRALRGR